MRNKWFFLLGALLLVWSCRNDTAEPARIARPGVGVPVDSLVHRLAIPSVSMQKVFNAYVILPESYYLDNSKLSFPVVYLLHGYGGGFANWYDKAKALVDYASLYDIIIVTPEGGASSWYLDSPKDSLSRFASYVGQEVPAYVESHFRIQSSPRKRAIAGLSMGGHGALSIALAHPGWYGAAGSMSGVVDLRPFPNRWEIARHLGAPVAGQDSLLDPWYTHSVIYQASTSDDWPAMIINCGTEDELIGVNRSLHQALLAREVPHTYMEHPGGHNWTYWDEAVAYQLQFFDRFFDR